jgi:hypothetical protein
MRIKKPRHDYASALRWTVLLAALAIMLGPPPYICDSPWQVIVGGACVALVLIAPRWGDCFDTRRRP